MIAYTRTPRPDAARELGVELVDLPMLLAESDAVTLHVPLESSTRHLIGEPELRAMKSSAILINTARGAVVNQEAMIRAINEEWIVGVALWTFSTSSPCRRTTRCGRWIRRVCS